MKKALIVPVKTIGDALILTIAANSLKNLGYEVTIMHDSFLSFQNWFSKFHLIKTSIKDLGRFDHIFIQHDDARLNEIKKIKKTIKNKRLTFIYFRYRKSKHGKLTDLDITLDEDKSIAKGLAENIQKLFNQSKKSIDTGITIPENLTHKKYPKRIVIQPTSSDSKKCWSKSKFIKICKKLKALGFKVSISVAPNERSDWYFVHKMEIDLPLFHTLSDLSSYIYESGYLIGNDSFAVHLASLLQIPHIMIAANKNLVKTWPPGWLKSNIILPSSWAPNLKFFRLREKHFSFFIPVKKVFLLFCLTHSQ